MPSHTPTPPERIGQRFGRLMVLAEAENKPRRLLCRCDCGTEKVINAFSLTSGRSTSCGCYRREFRVSHGESASVEYKIWRAIKQRCRDPNNVSYQNYGARGIDICCEWADDFAAFLAAVGQRPTVKHSIERLDNARGYEPGNVVWATKAQQDRNRRNNVVLSFRGKSQCLTDWAAELGIAMVTLQGRLRKGWSVERALSLPVDRRFANKRAA